MLKNLFFAGILKVNDENRRIWIQDPDPLVRGMDPRIRNRIRIHPKMSWIRNIGCIFFVFIYIYRYSTSIFVSSALIGLIVIIVWTNYLRYHLLKSIRLFNVHIEASFCDRVMGVRKSSNLPIDIMHSLSKVQFYFNAMRRQKNMLL